MIKVNTETLPETFARSPGGRFARGNRDVSVALGRRPDSEDARERHPFDVQITRIPAGASRCPYHLHTAQWEYYQVLSGTGSVRHREGVERIGPGDAFLFRPLEAHQLINDSEGDLVVLVVADNPVGEACHYPDSGKWSIEIPSGPILRSGPVDYFDGEE